MIRSGVAFGLGVMGLTLVVVLLGLVLVGPAERVGVLVGGGVALVLQLGIFGVLGHVLFPGRRLLVFALGMVVRVLGLGVLVLITVRLGLPPAPTLLTMVSVFLVTTVLEPLLIQLELTNVR